MNQYKLSKGEVERRKILMKSKNAALVKNDFLQRDPNRAPTQAEIETELKRLQVNLILTLFNQDILILFTHISRIIINLFAKYE